MLRGSPNEGIASNFEESLLVAQSSDGSVMRILRKGLEQQPLGDLG